MIRIKNQRLPIRSLLVSTDGSSGDTIYSIGYNASWLRTGAQNSRQKNSDN